MQANLPLDVLRSFTAIVDAGSMLKAADRVFLSQSALSLQVKRLEELLQFPLFSREGRRLALTPAGEVLLGYARRLLALNDEAIRVTSGAGLNGPLRIGMVQDYAETLLTGVLAQFMRLHPEAPVQARVGGTLELLEMVEQGALDVALGFVDPGSAAELRRDAVIWIGSPALASQEVLPLAVLEKPCRFREAAIRALDAAGRPYRLALETPNLSTLRAGVEAGLGLTCRTALFRSGADDGDAVLNDRLPPLGMVATALWIKPGESIENAGIAALLADVVMQAAQR